MRCKPWVAALDQNSSKGQQGLWELAAGSMFRAHMYEKQTASLSVWLHNYQRTDCCGLWSVDIQSMATLVQLSVLCFAPRCRKDVTSNVPIEVYKSALVFQNYFTFTLPPSSSALLQTPECSEYHPSEQSHGVSALSLTRLQLSGTNSLFLSAILLLSALLNLSWKPFSFKKPFLQSYCPDCADMRLVCVCVCVRTCASLCVCVHSCCMHWILTNMYL